MTELKSRIVGQGTANPSELLANPFNFRRHPKEQLDALEATLEQIGWIQQVIVNQTTGHMIDGHARVEIGVRRKETEIPLVYVNLTEEEERIALATFDPITGMATQDNEQLDALISQILDESDISDEVDLLLRQIAEDDDLSKKKGKLDPDEAPEPTHSEARSRPGDVWILGEHRLICGDSTEPAVFKHLMQGDKADQLLSDPPYGCNYVAKLETMTKRTSGGKTKHAHIENDTQVEGGYLSFFHAFLSCCAEYAAEYNTAYLFISSHEHDNLRNAFIQAGGNFSGDLIWVKDTIVLGMGDYNYQHEPIVYGWFGKHRFYGGYPASVFDDVPSELSELSKEQLVDLLNSIRNPANSSVIRWPRPKRAALHPTMKPVDLFEEIMRHGCPPFGIVLDPFGGSGTSLIAAERTDKKARLIERSPVYCDVICKRWQEFTGKQAHRLSDGLAFDDVKPETTNSDGE